MNMRSITYKKPISIVPIKSKRSTTTPRAFIFNEISVVLGCTYLRSHYASMHGNAKGIL